MEPNDVVNEFVRVFNFLLQRNGVKASFMYESIRLCVRVNFGYGQSIIMLSLSALHNMLY